MSKHAATPGTTTEWVQAENVNVEPYKPNDMGMAYVLLVLGGLFGMHRMYLGHFGSGIAMAVLTISLIGLPVTLVWWIVDLFLVPGMFFEKTNTG